MKFHKLYIAAIGAASMAMAGCELDIVNSDQLNTTNMWVDESDVTGATTGIYFELRNAFRQNYTNQFFWGELRVGPAMWDRGTNRSLMDSDMLEVLHSLLNGGTSSVSWTNLYTCINQCNSVIKYAPSVEMSDETRSYCLGNAYFVRAYVYYWIARVWGDAPVILTPTESTGREIYPSRSPRAEVYAQVAQDIESALTHITSNAKGCYYATVDNINMLKADFALWMYAAQKGGDSYLTMAGEALDAVTRTPLLGKFADVFDVKNKANKEIAFALHVDATNEVHSASYIQRFIWGSTQVKASYRNVEGGVPVSSNQWFCYADEFIGELKRNKEQNNDQRSDVTYMERTGVSDMYEKVGWPNKFTGDWSSGTLLYDDDLILYRYAQYYMFRAELYYYRKQYKEALGELNVVAQRAYGKADFYTSATQQDVLEALGIRRGGQPVVHLHPPGLHRHLLPAQILAQYGCRGRRGRFDEPQHLPLPDLDLGDQQEQQPQADRRLVLIHLPNRKLFSYEKIHIRPARHRRGGIHRLLRVGHRCGQHEPGGAHLDFARRDRVRCRRADDGRTGVRHLHRDGEPLR